MDLVNENFLCVFFSILGEITLIATAPLTNIAVALRMNPEISELFKNVVIMGGNLFGKLEADSHIILTTNLENDNECK